MNVVGTLRECPKRYTTSRSNYIFARSYLKVCCLPEVMRINEFIWMHAGGGKDYYSFRRYWVKVLRHQWEKCDTFMFNNWPGSIPKTIDQREAPSYPSFQIERWREISIMEYPNPSFSPMDGITLVGPLKPQVLTLLIQRPNFGRICAWFDVAICKGESVRFHIQDWGEHTRIYISMEEIAQLRVPTSYIDKY